MHASLAAGMVFRSRGGRRNAPFDQSNEGSSNVILFLHVRLYVSVHGVTLGWCPMCLCECQHRHTVIFSVIGFVAKGSRVQYQQSECSFNIST
jgi:hypothetical protein